MKRAVVVIPARWGSTRFPGKPLHLIAGKPLLRHVWERALKVRGAAQVIVATDDMRIAEAAFAWGAEIALTSARHASGTDRIAEVAGRLKQTGYVINIQGDEPLLDPRLVDRLITALRKDAGIEMITAAHPFADPADAASPHQVKVVLTKENDALYFSRSPIPFRRGKTAPPCLRHQGIYGYRRETLLRFVSWKPTPLEQAESLEQLRALEHGVRIHVLVTKHGFAGVDTPEDADAVAALLRKGARSPRVAKG